MSNKTIVTIVDENGGEIKEQEVEEEEESDSSSENENESTTPSPIPLPLPALIPSTDTAYTIPSPLNTSRQQQPTLSYQHPVIIDQSQQQQVNNPFPAEALNVIFSPSSTPNFLPQNKVDQIFMNYDVNNPPSISPVKFIANKNDSFTKSNSGGKNVNFMRRLYEKEKEAEEKMKISG